MLATLRDPLLDVAAVIRLPAAPDYPPAVGHAGRHYALSADPAAARGTYHEVPAPGRLRFDGRVPQSAYEVVPVQGIEARRLVA